MSLYLKVAKESFPHGARLDCQLCGGNMTVTVEQIAEYFETGWPKHCSRTMAAKPLKEEKSA